MEITIEVMRIVFIQLEFMGSKLCGEMILKAYNQTFDLPYTIIRSSALYGKC